MLAGERGWIPMSINLAHVPVIKTHWDAVEEGRKKQACLRLVPHGVSPARSTLQRPLNRHGKRHLKGTLGRDFRDYWFNLFSPGNFKPDPDMDDADMTLEHLLDTLWIVGSPDHVANRLRELYEEVGGFGVLLAMGHEWEPREQWLNSMTLLKNEVMPQLADLT